MAMAWTVHIGIGFKLISGADLNKNKAIGGGIAIELLAMAMALRTANPTSGISYQTIVDRPASSSPGSACLYAF
jgi:hypothetical protein